MEANIAKNTKTKPNIEIEYRITIAVRGAYGLFATKIQKTEHSVISIINLVRNDFKLLKKSIYTDK